MKTRTFSEENYKAIYFNGKTIRIAIDQSKPIKELKYPEFYDVKLTDRCFGKCPYCYMDSTSDGKHGENIVKKINKYFGSMTENERPLQVALGGGCPVENPEFIESLKAFYDLGITPNYTTNGMWSFNKKKSNKIIETTKKYCGGVAVSCHNHLEKYWTNAANLLLENGIKLNFHIVISDSESSDKFREIYDRWNKKIDYFVLLPYGSIGRAEQKEIDWKYMVSAMPEDTSKIAFGANFYQYLIDNPKLFNVSLYEPEAFSQYIDFVEDRIYPSSFHSKEDSEKIIWR